MTDAARPWPARLPFYYGWVIIGIAFVTIGVAVSIRTAFSLMLPPLIGEFGWDRGLVAGAFSFGFLVSACLSPIVGRLMDRFGPRLVILSGITVTGTGLFLGPHIAEPWHLYLTLGVLVGAGANMMSYTAQSLYLPNWFVRRRAFAISIAFSGVGVGAIVLLPWLQTIIEQAGWRTASWTMGMLVVLVLVPLNLFVWKKPEQIGLLADGASRKASADGKDQKTNIVDPAWAAVEWTLSRAVRTGRFWWVMVGFFFVLIAWYAVQVHQTKYLIDIGFDPITAGWALGIVAAVSVPGQIGLGALSDRIGREWVWSIGCFGFAVCYGALIVLEHHPNQFLLLVMICSQGMLGYSIAALIGPIVAEIFEGPHYGTIFGTATVALIGGGAAGPWITGVIYDATGSYQPAFYLAIACCFVSAAAIWIAAPRKVRMVPGRMAAR